VEGRTAEITGELFEKIMNRASEVVERTWDKEGNGEYKVALLV